MATRRGAWRNGVALIVAAAALAVFGLLGAVLASTDITAPSVSRSSLPGIASATASVAALGWASWTR